MTAGSDEADERWREVLFELLRRAREDPDFRARVEATGAVITELEAVLARHRDSHPPHTGKIACREYWWGFQLEIPHAILERWSIESADPAHIAAEIGAGIGPSAAFRRRVAAWIARRLAKLVQLDRGAGVYTSMTWMAPNIFIPMPIAPADPTG